MVTIRYGDTFLKTFIFTDSDLSLRLEMLVLLKMSAIEKLN